VLQRPGHVSLLLLTAFVLWGQPARAASVPSERECADARAELETVLRISDTRVEVRALAEWFAPVLWFSAEEPLLALDGAGHLNEDLPHPRARKKHDFRIPAPLPADEQGKPVVYYDLLEPRSATLVEGRFLELGPMRMGDRRRLQLRYFFYYPQDSGVNGHLHDLEAADFEFVALKERSGVRLRLRAVKALAHGLDWTANRLRFDKEHAWADSPMPDDATVPVTLFVEEGKHASCPDRNGDGRYEPGYDVNHYSREAWGVRDTFGSGILVSQYSADTTKKRNAKERVFPRSAYRETLATLYACTAPRELPVSAGSWESGYQLLNASTSWLEDYEVYCRDPQECDKRLCRMMQANGFGQPPHLGIWGSFKERFSLTLRRDVGLRAALLSRVIRVPLPEGWVIGRLSSNLDDVATEILFSPTASRWIDWYVGGAGFFHDPTRKEPFFKKFGFRPEVGIKLRINIEPIGQWLGIRLGLKSEELSESFDLEGARPGAAGLRGVRFVWEIGGGAW